MARAQRELSGAAQWLSILASERKHRKREYGEMITIFISMNSWDQLRGGRGNWFDPIAYRKKPSKQFPVKTSVPISALEGGKFHPERYEPDVVDECCERVM